MHLWPFFDKYLEKNNSVKNGGMNKSRPELWKLSLHDQPDPTSSGLI